MRRWRKWTLVALGMEGSSASARVGQALAEEWNNGERREWFWTRRGAESAARFYTQLMPIVMIPVHAAELEERLVEPAS